MLSRLDCFNLPGLFYQYRLTLWLDTINSKLWSNHCHGPLANIRPIRGLVVAQMSFAEVRSLNPVTGKFLYRTFFTVNCWKGENKNYLLYAENAKGIQNMDTHPDALLVGWGVIGNLWESLSSKKILRAFFLFNSNV